MTFGFGFGSVQVLAHFLLLPGSVRFGSWQNLGSS